jgi:ABC-type phosphate transport system substrate-binding protein
MEKFTPKPELKMSVLRTLLLSYVFLPVGVTVCLIIPTFLLSVAFGVVVPDWANYVYFILAPSALSVVFALMARGQRGMGVPTKNVALNTAAIFFPPALTIVAVVVTTLVSSTYYGGIAAWITNPVWMLFNYLAWISDESTAIWLMPIVMSVYSLTTFLLHRKALTAAYYAEKQQQPIDENSEKTDIAPEKTNIAQKAIKKFGFKRVATVAAVLLLATIITATAALAYPEFEYRALKQRFGSLSFNDEVDYYFYDKVPFYERNGLATLDEVPTLTFPDWRTAPSLDGATAFYPMYGAFTQFLYTDTATVEEVFQNYGHEVFVDEQTDRYVIDDFGVLANKVLCTKTNRAYERLIEGKTDVIFTFEPSQEQIAAATAAGVQFHLTKLGYDAFCFFVNVDNKVTGLTSAQIVDIYSGKIGNWKKVGGDYHSIFAFTRPVSSGSQTIMENKVMQGVPIDTRFVATTAFSMGGMIEVVGGYLNSPYAIGYTFMYYSMSMVTNDKIRYLAVDGVMPTEENVRSGAYPYTVPFYAVTLKGQEDAETLALLDWLTGEQAQQLIEKTGYVGL